MNIGTRTHQAWRAGLFLLVGLTALGTGCKKSDQSAGEKSGGMAGKTIMIGVIGKSVANPVFQAADAGARDAGRTLGPKYGVTVDINVQTPPSEDAKAQADAIDNLVRGGAAGILVSCSDAGVLTPAINRAVDAGLAVMCFDSDAPLSKRFAFYGTDDISCGERVMDELAKAMNDKGTVAILAGSASAPNLQARVQGVRDALKKYPDMKELNNGHGVFNHPETPSDAAEMLKATQTTNPQIQGWALVGGWPLFAKNALNWPAGSIKVVSVDALPAEMDYLKDGHVQVLLGQDCYGWGTKSVEILLDKIVKKKNPSTVRIIAPLTVVTKANADEYMKNWDKWLTPAK